VEGERPGNHANQPEQEERWDVAMEEKDGSASNLGELAVN
jgi:hypothetical protein